VQEVWSVYRTVLRQRLRTILARQPAVYRQREVFSWMWTYWLGRSQLS